MNTDARYDMHRAGCRSIVNTDPRKLFSINLDDNDDNLPQFRPETFVLSNDCLDEYISRKR